MKININNFIRKSIICICIYLIFINFICDFFSVPTIIRYIPDLFIPIYIAYVFANVNAIAKRKSTKILLYIILLFFLHCLVGNIINYNSITYFIWGFRNIFRFLFIGLAAIVSFNDADINTFIKMIDIAFFVNIIICIFQYSILGYWGDAIGGTFRLGDTGGNAGLIYIMIIELTILMNKYLNKEGTLIKLLIAMISTIFISVIAELKVMYVFIAIIILLSIIMTKFTFKKFLIITFSILVFIFGFNTLKKLDPNTAKIMNINALMEYAGGESHGYSSQNDISRLRAFEQIDYIFFNGSKINKIWGYGLGHCDVSSISIFNSKFAQTYDKYLHYSWFTHAMLYIETGLVGYLLFISFFIYIIVYCIKTKNNNKYINNCVVIISFLSIIMTFYNSSLRNDISYFVYIVLILPMILNSKKQDINDENKNISKLRLRETKI